MSTAVIITCTDCGHATGPTTPAVAAYGYRAHSCATTQMRAERRQRRLDRLALSGPEQPCTHNSRHTHGTYACYVLDRCHCRPCRDANRVYEQGLSRRRAYGQATYVDAGPARAHITALMAAGMGLKRIVAVSSISQGVLWRLIYGRRRPDGTRVPSKRIRPATEQAILSVTLDLAGGACIDATGTTRRIQALVAIGWSQSKIAARLGIQRSNFTAIAQGRIGVTVARAKAVAALYDELWDQAPPHTQWRDHAAYSRALNYAAKAGWSVPMAWDDIDDPAARPDLGENNAPSWQKVHLDDVEWLIGDGSTLEQIAHRFGVHQSTVEHACDRAGRRDLLDRMLRNKTAQENVA